MSVVAPDKPSPISVLTMASIAGACWFVAALALCLTLLFYVERDGAHGNFSWVWIAFGVFTLAAVGGGATLSALASSRLRRLLGSTKDAA